MSDRIFSPGRRRKGDPITADDRNARDAALARNGRLSGTGGLVVREGSANRSLALITPETANIKLTTTANGDGGYGAKEVLGAAAGTWIDSGRTMPQSGDPCYERNHNVSLVSGDRVYLARRAATTGEWIFAHRTIGGGGGGTGSMPGCTCSTPPATLYMTVSGTCDPDLYNNCTIQYGATPPLLVGSLGANGYFSTTTFTESSSGDLFYINLFCTGSTMSIRRVFESATSFGGAPYVDTVFFFWTVGFPGNACSPFLLSNGDDGSGSPPCTVTISE